MDCFMEFYGILYQIIGDSIMQLLHHEFLDYYT